MSTNLRKDDIEENTLLIDWTLQIYGILYSIWLGFFIDSLTKNGLHGKILLDYIEKNNINQFKEIFSSIFIIAFLITIGFFTFSFIQWLFCMRLINENQGYHKINSLLKQSKKFIVPSSISLFILFYTHGVKFIWLLLGVTIILSWFQLVKILILSDRKRWLI